MNGAIDIKALTFCVTSLRNALLIPGMWAVLGVKFVMGGGGLAGMQVLVGKDKLQEASRLSSSMISIGCDAHCFPI